MLPNRIVMPPMVIWQAAESAEVNERHLKHYRDRQGPGLIIVEATTVSPEGRLNEHQLGAFEDRQISGLTKLAKVIHDGGGAAGIQLHHAGGLLTIPYIVADGSTLIISINDEEKIREVVRSITIE